MIEIPFHTWNLEWNGILDLFTFIPFHSTPPIGGGMWNELSPGT